MNLNYSSSSDESPIKKQPVYNNPKLILPSMDHILSNKGIFQEFNGPQIPNINEIRKNIIEDFHDVPPPDSLLTSLNNEKDSRYARYNKRKEPREMKEEYECPVINKFIKLNEDKNKDFKYDVEEKLKFLEEKSPEKKPITKHNFFKPPQLKNNTINHPTI